MSSTLNFSQYPKAKVFFEQHPEMSIDQAINFLKKQLEE